MFLAAVYYSGTKLWLGNGGRKTLQSYDVDIADEITWEHIQFMMNLPCRHVTDTHVFVHAGLDLEHDKIGGRKVISGHTVRDIDDIVESLETNFLQLDNGCFMGTAHHGKGNLIALELNSGELFVQENIE